MLSCSSPWYTRVHETLITIGPSSFCCCVQLTVDFGLIYRETRRLAAWRSWYFVTSLKIVTRLPNQNARSKTLLPSNDLTNSHAVSYPCHAQDSLQIKGSAQQVLELTCAPSSTLQGRPPQCPARRNNPTAQNRCPIEGGLNTTVCHRFASWTKTRPAASIRGARLFLLSRPIAALATTVTVCRSSLHSGSAPTWKTLTPRLAKVSRSK